MVRAVSRIGENKFQLRQGLGAPFEGLRSGESLKHALVGTAPDAGQGDVGVEATSLRREAERLESLTHTLDQPREAPVVLVFLDAGPQDPRPLRVGEGAVAAIRDVDGGGPGGRLLQRLADLAKLRLRRVAEEVDRRVEVLDGRDLQDALPPLEVQRGLVKPLADPGPAAKSDEGAHEPFHGGTLPPGYLPGMTPDELRKAWFDFFVERGHAHLPSDSLVPENDPTLLFTGAGMNQFKAEFAGKGSLPHTRVTTIQKCFRRGDLENVGRTPRHLTFFEMMGHFSFGDYFKKEAVAWAWEFLLKVVELPKDKLWITIYEGDDEAEEAWKAVGLSPDRILRCDAKENFWPANAPAKGPNGVCGPCTEIFYDYGREFAVGDGGPKAYDSGQYVEIWNSVFTQFDRREGGELVPLPQKNIDCGAGFERVLAAIHGQISPFSTPIFKPIVERVADLVGFDYQWDPKGGQMPGDDPRRMRRIAEHARAACMLVSDGVKPGNEGRGYVLRLVMRRAIRDGITLGLNEPFLDALVDDVVDTMKGGYPGLDDGRTVLKSVMRGEDERFRETYHRGVKYLEEELGKLGNAGTLPGAVAFKLYDTYGFPLDLAQLILEDRGIDVDEAGFEKEMEAQRERARAGSKIATDIFAGGPLTELKGQGARDTEFLGHDGEGLEGEGEVLGIICGETGELVPTAGEGESITVIVDKTPFYAESGGQVGDSGTMSTGNAELTVQDAQGSEGFTLHKATVVKGTLEQGDTVTLVVDKAARDATRRNHTATHLMHYALKVVLGEHVQQEGSLVAPDRLRFDFRHDKALKPEEIVEIERLVNAWIVRNDDVVTQVLPIEEAKASGAVSMFGEKYGDVVRVLSIDSGSKEFCGGTHCFRTGDIGSFRVTVETSIAAGIRRIEAVTGEGAVEAFERDRDVVNELSQIFKAGPDEVVDRVKGLQDDIKAMKKAAEKAKLEAGAQAAAKLADDAEDVGGLKVLAHSLDGVDSKALKGVVQTLLKKGVDVAALIGEANGKAPVLVAVSKAGQDRGLAAKDLLQAMTAKLKGGGGGSPAMAQGQGQDRTQIEAALENVRSALRGHA